MFLKITGIVIAGSVFIGVWLYMHRRGQHIPDKKRLYTFDVGQEVWTNQTNHVYKLLKRHPEYDSNSMRVTADDR